MHQHISARPPTLSHIMPPISSPVCPPTVRINDLVKEIGDLNLWRRPQTLPGMVLPVKEKQSPGGSTNEILAPEHAQIEKQAARMIVIRRRKMKKHKLQKLRKRRKFEYIRISQKRKVIKERAFETKLVNQIKEAKAFNAQAYVKDLIQKASEEFVDTRLPLNHYHKKNPVLHVNGKRTVIPTHVKAKWILFLVNKRNELEAQLFFIFVHCQSWIGSCCLTVGRRTCLNCCLLCGIFSWNDLLRLALLSWSWHSSVLQYSS